MGEDVNIQDELLATVVKYRTLGRLNYYAAFALYGVSVLSSILATGTALSHVLSAPAQAALTAVPGAALLIASTFKFSERSNWHYKKKNQLNALYRLAITQAAGTSAPQIAEKWNKIDSSMEESWPGFGTLSVASSEQKRASR